MLFVSEITVRIYLKKIEFANLNNVLTKLLANDNIKEHLINNKKFSSVNLETKNKYTLVTNLNLKDYTDDKIKEIYSSRWNVEVFFKILKSNFIFSDLKITNDELAKSNMNYSIHNIKILIVYLLAKIMEKVHQRVKKIKLIDVIKKRKIK